METVQQAYQTASNAVWNGVDALRGNNQTEQRVNQHGDEPMSGIQGKGTVADPYDAGNRDEQIGAPINKDNTAVVTEPLASTSGTTGTTGTFNDKYQNQSDKANLVTSTLGPQNPRVDHPEPVQGKQHTSGPVAMSTLKDEPLSTHKSTLKDESITSSGPAPDKAETIATHKASAADAATAAYRSASGSGTGSGAGSDSTIAAGTGTGSTSASKSGSTSEAPNNSGNTFSTTEPASEQRTQPSTTQPEITKKDKQVPATAEADSETGGISPAEAAQKKGISPEALRGPSVGPPRESYERQMKSVGSGGGSKKQDDEPKTSKPEDKDHKDHKDHKEKDEHHHKSMKERLNKVLHHH
ncbi:uncharacterized protein BDV17DRAFT_289278 [Aspergillus undulatus]|uniref:uncharacterized protein n=1 Tax=Aspergillus undulatus TaxID=1810928 RepID=UPI003CCD0391